MVKLKMSTYRVNVDTPKSNIRDSKHDLLRADPEGGRGCDYDWPQAASWGSRQGRKREDIGERELNTGAAR